MTSRARRGLADLARARIVVAGLVGLLVPASAARASCLDEAVARLDARVESRRTLFLVPEQRGVGELRLATGGCVAVLATATRPDATVDGALYAHSGLELDGDGPRTPHAVLRACGSAGQRLHWSVRVTAPTEVELAVLGAVSWPLPDLSRVGGACFAAAPGLRSPVPDLGRPPPEEPADARIARWVARSRRRGYRVLRREQVRPREGRAERRLSLRAGRCTLVAAFPAIGAVDLSLRAPDGRELAADRRRAVDGHLAACPREDTEATLVVHDAGGAQDVTLILLAQPVRGPAGLDGAALRRWAEAEARVGPLAPTGWLHLRAGESVEQTMGVDGCGAVAAFVADEAGGRVEMQLLDAAGRWEAASPPGPSSLLSHCRRGSVRLRVRMLRGGGRVLLARATAPSAEGPR